MLLSSEQVFQMDGACGSSSKMPHFYESNGAFVHCFPGLGFNALPLYHAFSPGTCRHALCFFLTLPTLLFPTFPLNVDLFYVDSAEVLTGQCSCNHLQTNLHAMISSLGQLTTFQLDLGSSRMSGWEKTASAG